MRARGHIERLRDQTAQRFRRTAERRTDKLLQADQQIARYMDAAKQAHGPGLGGVSRVTYSEQTGWYHVAYMGGRHKKLRAKDLTQEAEVMYAKAHEIELNAPED